MPALIALALGRSVAAPGAVVVAGLALFAVVFAMNSSIHSVMVLACGDAEAVSLSVGFSSMAYAAGRLLGTLLSGWTVFKGGMETRLHLPPTRRQGPTTGLPELAPAEGGVS